MNKLAEFFERNFETLTIDKAKTKNNVKKFFFRKKNQGRIEKSIDINECTFLLTKNRVCENKYTTIKNSGFR